MAIRQALQYKEIAERRNADTLHGRDCTVLGPCRSYSAMQIPILAVSTFPAARDVLMWQIAQSTGKEQP